MASRIAGLKGIGISILSISVLINQGIDATLIIAGDGEQKNELINLVIKLGLEKKIKFIGYQFDMAKFYSTIDIYISTPVAEAFGLSCIEAMSNGIPVIFPLLNGQPEAIKNKFCGIGIIPELSDDKYHQMTELNIDFPHKVYDPVNDKMTSPKLIDPNKCASAVRYVIDNYTQLSQNALTWSQKTMDYDLFIKEFELAIRK